MEKLEKLLFRGIFGVGALIATYLFLFLNNIDIPLNWITLLFAFFFGWPAIIVILIVFLF